jgi:hypothetical protein
MPGSHSNDRTRHGFYNAGVSEPAANSGSYADIVYGMDRAQALAETGLDSAFPLPGRTAERYGQRSGIYLAAGLAAGAVQQQVHAAGNGGTHLLGPADGVVVEDLAGAQALQVVTVGRAGHARGRAPMAAAICTAALPTPPAAAVVSTVCPGCSRLGETRLAGHGGEAVGRGQRQFSEPATRREQARVHPLARLDAGPVAGRFDDSATS